MSRSPRWVEGALDKGVMKVELYSWRYFSDYISQRLLDYTTYVFRGHGDSRWKLEPTIDRYVHDPVSPLRKKLLEDFKYATRGRRGANPSAIDEENDWWALGQHHGLYTPLLDWTESPFVALYFAASTAYKERTEKCSVFALSQYSISENNKLIRDDEKIKEINGRKPTVKIVRPLSDENSRLVSQRGLFTRGPNNMSIEDWVRRFNAGAGRGVELFEITMPSRDMEKCLRYLNRMNINHATLFPDLSGASVFCNNCLLIDKY